MDQLEKKPAQTAKASDAPALTFKILSISSTPIISDPLEAKSIEIAKQVRAFAQTEMQEAINTGDFPRWLRGQSVSNAKPTDFKWILDLGGEFEKFSFEDFLKDHNRQDNINEFSNKAARMQRLLSKLKPETSSDDICVAISRSRLDDERTIRYQSVARFPEHSKETGYWIYEPKGVMCAEHCCDVLYKDAREKNGISRLKYKTLMDLHEEANLRADSSSRVEFKEVAAEMNDEVRAAKREMTRALMRYYSNLDKVRIPEEFI